MATRNEKETREQLIDPKLKHAGWQIVPVKHAIEKSKACIETKVEGMTKSTTNPTGVGFVDYTLFGDDGKPLAIIEAKKSTINEEQGRYQACLYADALEKKYGVRPIIYYTNGYVIKVLDGIYPAREVYGFHRKDELEYLIRKRNSKITDRAPRADICGRYYQIDAIAEVVKHLESKHSRSLIVLATGTGKTRVSCGLSDIFIRNNFVKRILFLADRKNLVVQAKEETYDRYLPNIPMATIIEGKRDGADDARIVFSTYQSMLSIIQDETKCPFGIGHFDLIIVDEAHRSLFAKYAQIFDYFDALMIGLTATPRDDIHKSTFKVFNLATDMPNYEYDLVKAVKDGFLVYYRALDRTPDILKNGLVYDNLSEDDKEEYELLFTEDDGTIPEKIEGDIFASTITNEKTIRVVLQNLMEEGLRVDNGDTLGKTIIFARDQHHAKEIQKIFTQMYPDLCADNPNYCVVIHSAIPYNDVLQREFKSKQDIRIVVSVDMMDTGVDIPEVVNLVFFKKVLSKIKFWQMVGRGTRLCPDLKVVSPSKAYFERQTNDGARQHYNGKQGFLIFDVCNVFNFFKLNPDGKEDNSESVLSLNQKIFMEKVALLQAMQKMYTCLSADDKAYYTELQKDLVDTVKGLNRNYIGVQKNLRYVEMYSESAAWDSLNRQKVLDIKRCIAPQVVSNIEIESARWYDYLSYRFAAAKLFKNQEVFDKTYTTMHKIVARLYNCKMHILDVAKSATTLQHVMTTSFLQDSMPAEINTVRMEIRELIRYLEREILDPIFSDFDDSISSTDDAIENAVDFHTSIDDFKSFKEKVDFYLQENIGKGVIKKIHSMGTCSNEEIAIFMNEIRQYAKTDEEFAELFPDEKTAAVYIRRHVGFNPDSKELFLQKWQAYGLTAVQLKYIAELLVYIEKNGTLSNKALTTRLSPRGIIDNVQMKEILTNINNLLRLQ